MARVYIGIGSNIDAEINVRKALILLARKTRVVTISNIYRTEPVGLNCPADQPDYMNGVAAIETELSPVDFKNTVLQEIENELDRVRTENKYAPRTIDMDILLYGDLVTSENGLTIPDPLIAERAFLAIPLHEIAPNLILPDSGMPIRELASKHANHTMVPMHEFTFRIKKELENGS